MNREAFFTLHRDLPREGPGEAADVLWAIAELGLSGPVRVADFACGPGADTEVFAEALPMAPIYGLDRTPHFVAAAEARLARFGPRVTLREGDMSDSAALGGPHDLIWCAAALYALGIDRALRLWRGALAPGGHIAFSEPVLLGDPPDEGARAFWADYPAVTGAAGLNARIEAAGFALTAFRILRRSAWEAYYLPQEARIAALRAEGVSPAVEAVLAAAEREIALWRAAPTGIAYMISIVAPA